MSLMLSPATELDLQECTGKLNTSRGVGAAINVCTETLMIGAYSEPISELQCALSYFPLLPKMTKDVDKAVELLESDISQSKCMILLITR